MTEPLAEEPREEIEGGFSRRTVGWIAGIAVVSFLASALLSVYGRDLTPKPFSGANTFSDSALGHRALAELLRAMGLGVASRQSFSGGVGPERPLVLAEPDSNLDRLASLRKEAKDRNAPLLVVLPKWRPGPPRKDRPEWLESVELLPPYQVLRVVQAVLEDDAPDNLELRLVSGDRLDCELEGGGGLAVSISDANLLVAHPGLEPVVRCRGGSLITRLKAKEGPAVYLISDPDLLNNHGLGRGANAEVVHSFLVRELGARGVVFDETIHGFERDTGLLAEAMRFPLVFGLLQGIVLLGVVLWTGMGRFGKPLPAPSPLGAGKEILIDNTAKLLTNGVHSEDSLAQYFRQTTRAVAAHYFIPSDLPDPDRLARLQKLTAARGHKLILADVERSVWKLPLGPRGAEAAARIARRLYQWRLEMTNVHRESP
ncbi:MAG TPA: DUF4350 domain-containing protein [Thermoanaerobaculia bacterium]